MKKIFFFLLVLLFSTNAFALDFYSHGYYRNRVDFYQNFDLQKKKAGATYDNNRFGLISFNQMRLRIDPLLKLNDFLVIHSQFDILDNIVYGSQDTKQLEILSPVVGTIALPAGAGSISMVGGAAGENGSINVRRAWAEVLTPIGSLRFGRQPSNWALGIFQNDGNGLQDDFGDTADRILFITQRQFDNGAAFSIGALWDIAYESQFDPTIQGLGGIVRDNGQSTNQFAGIAMYQRPNVNVGMFGGIRKRDGGNGTTTTAYAFDASTSTGLADTPTACGIDGDTLVYFIDAYGSFKYLNYNLKFEVVYLGGEMSTGVAINAVPLAPTMPGNPAGVIQLPAKQPVRVLMAAFEANARYKWGGEWELKAGYAQGDATPLSNRITQYGFRPDYRIALFMFRVPLGTSPAIVPNTGPIAGQKAAGSLPITGNFINNAIYAAATYKHHIDFGSKCKNCNDFSIGARVVSAFADEDPVSIDFADLLGDSSLPSVQSKGKWYGIETDLLVEGRFFDYMYASLEAGVLIPGSAYDINVNLINPGNIVAPIQSSKASIAYGGRISLIFEF